MLTYLYLALNLFSISYPLVKTWDDRVLMRKNQREIWISTTIVAAFFIVWDVLFTQQGFWGFNPNYLVGINIINLPLEEVLFFFCIPYACIFIYEVVRYFDKKNSFRSVGKVFNAVWLILTIGLLVVGYDKWYSMVTAVLLITLLLLHQFVIKLNKEYLGRFYLSFIFILIPFILVNGILTGTFIPDQVVWYSEQEIIGFRILTIPVEDLFYCLLMMLSIVTIYEGLIAKKKCLIA